MGDLGSIPGLGRYPVEGKYPLQNSCQENSMDCIVHGVAKNWTRLSDFHFPFPWRLSGKESACKAGNAAWGYEFDPWVGKIPWGRKWQPTPTFFCRKFHGQRSLVGFCPWGHEWVRYALRVNNKNKNAS